MTEPSPISLWGSAQLLILLLTLLGNTADLNMVNMAVFESSALTRKGTLEHEDFHRSIIGVSLCPKEAVKSPVTRESEVPGQSQEAF